MTRQLTGLWLGRRRYEPVHELMDALHEARRRGEIGDTVLFVEHEPVITLGRGAKREHVLLSEAALEKLGVDRVTTARGGDVTVHGPGQLVGYPILDLSPDRQDVRRYVGDLRNTMRQLAAGYGVDGGEYESQVGLWVDAAHPEMWRGAEHAERLAKLGAIGVRISRWITMHGFAFNACTDMSLFSLIVPCGIRDHGVTSLAALGREPAELPALAADALAILAETLNASHDPLRDESGSVLSRLLPGQSAALPSGAL
ncbi:MAG: lipoyl(octanoyl) transferase LipB [Polyangiaceae bacterium]